MMLPRPFRRLLLNAFRRPATIATRPKCELKLESLEDRTVPATITVNSISTGLSGVKTATNNDFTLINNAIQNANPGDIIVLNSVKGTTFGSFDWNETNAKNSWIRGSDGLASFTVGGVPGTGDVTDDADNYALSPPENLNNITLTAAAPVNGKYNAVIKKATTDSATVDVETFLYFDHSGTNSGWTISNLEIDYFDLAIGMYYNGGPLNAYDNTLITNNKINVPKDVKEGLNQAEYEDNVGILVGPGVDQRITNNYILLDGSGASEPTLDNYAQSVGILTQPAGAASYDELLIFGNRIEVQKASGTKPEIVIGVWDNASAHSSDITISNNTFTNKVTPKPSTSLERGFRISSHSSATTDVVYSNNTVVGANIGFQWQPNYPGTDFTGKLPVQLTGNSTTNTETGVLIQSNGVADLSNNTFANGGLTSVGVQLDTGTLSADGNIITGNVTGVVIAGGTVGTINGNAIYGNTTFNFNDATAAAIDATGNWWGSTAGPTLINNTGGGSVDTSAFLTTATAVQGVTAFDFQKAVISPVQAGAIPLLSTHAYTAALTYGWVVPPTAPVGADLTETAAAPLANNPQAPQLRDGVASTTDDNATDTGARVFRMDFPDAIARQITVFLGNGAKAYSNIKVSFSTDSTNGVDGTFTPFTPGSGANVALKLYTSVSTADLFPVGITPGGATNSIFIRIEDGAVGGSNGWAIAGLSVVPLGSLGALAITPTSPGPKQVSAAVDTFTITGATPGALLGISATLGTIVTPDISTAVAGRQVLADSTGSATFQILRPMFAGDSTISVNDFAANSTAATLVQTYTAAAAGSVFNFDMNIVSTSVSPSLPDGTYQDVKNTTLFSGGSGFGWGANVKSKDLATNFPVGSDAEDQSLFRDYNYNTVNGTFSVFIGANQNASVTIYSFATTASQSPVGMTAGATGGAVSAPLAVGETSITITGTSGVDGILTITLAKGLVSPANKAWVVNGIEITLTP